MTPRKGGTEEAFEGADFEYPVPLLIRNTFVHCHPDQPNSLAEFFEERQIRSCPGSWVRTGLKLLASARTTIYESDGSASDDGDAPAPLREPEAEADYPELSPTPEPDMHGFSGQLDMHEFRGSVHGPMIGMPLAELSANAAPLEPSCDYGYPSHGPFPQNGQPAMYTEGGPALPAGTHDCLAQRGWQEPFQGAAPSPYGHFLPESEQLPWPREEQEAALAWERQLQLQQGAALPWETPGPGEHFGGMCAVGGGPLAAGAPGPMHCPPESLPPMIQEATTPAPPRTCGFAAADAADAATARPSEPAARHPHAAAPSPRRVPLPDQGPRMLLQLSTVIDDLRPEATPAEGHPAGRGDLPSVGSALHHEGRCKPCAFLHTKGCGNGLACTFCHLCGAGEKKRRRKEKVEGQRAMRAAQKGRLLDRQC